MIQLCMGGNNHQLRDRALVDFMRPRRQQQEDLRAFGALSVFLALTDGVKE
jgi:hypothetical protein